MLLPRTGEGVSEGEGLGKLMGDFYKRRRRPSGDEKSNKEHRLHAG